MVYLLDASDCSPVGSTKLVTNFFSNPYCLPVRWRDVGIQVPQKSGPELPLVVDCDDFPLDLD